MVRGIASRVRLGTTKLTVVLAMALAAVLVPMAGATSNKATRTVAPSISPAFASDDFNRTQLGQDWAVVDPVGDGTVTITGAATPDARLELAVPGGVNHDPWHNNRSLRAMRQATDVDFTAVAKFDSTPTQRFQTQGVLVQQDAANWVRFDIYHNGSSLRAFAASTVGGSSTKRIEGTTQASASHWLRVQRAGDIWTLATSTNGQTWSTKGSFAHPLDVTAVGPFVGNSGSPIPAYTALVDYLFEASAPIDPEDTPPSSATHELTTSVVGSGSITREPDQAAYPEGLQVTLTAVPQPGSVFGSWGGDLTGSDNPAQLTIDADKSVTATFAPDTTPPVVSGVAVAPSSSSAVVSWTTNEPATSSVDVGTTTTYSHGTFGSSTLTQSHSVTVTGLAAGTTYHYRVRSANGAGLTTTEPDRSFTTPASSGPVINAWYGDHQVVGGNGQTQLFYNLLGKVADPNGVAALSYSVNGGPSRSLSIGPDGRRLQEPGDFNADIPWGDLDPGGNEIVLTARDGASNVSTRTVVLDRRTGSEQLPYSTEWGSAARIGDQAQAVDGRWGLDGDTVRPLGLGYDRLLMLGDIAWHDYEMTVPVTVYGLGPGHNSHHSGPAMVGLALNWRGHTQVASEQPYRYWYPTGAFAWFRWYSPQPKFELRGSEDSPVVRNQSWALQFGQTYTFKARSETVAGGVQYSWKVWAAGAPEPSTWFLTVFESNGPATGSVGLIAHHVDARFGNVTVTPL